MLTLASQIPSLDLVDWSDPINRAHPVARGMLGFWMGIPNCRGGVTWRNLLHRWHGTITGATWSGYSFTTDGTDDNVSIPDNALNRPGSGPFSIAVCCVPPNANQFDGIFGKRTSSGNFPTFGLFHGELTGGGGATSNKKLTAAIWSNFSTANQTAITTADVADGNEHTIVMSWAGGATQATVNVDGRNQAMTSVVASGSPSMTLTDAWKVAVTDTNYYAATFRWAAMWNRVMGNADSLALYRDYKRGFPTLFNRIPLPFSMMQAAAVGNPWYYYSQTAG